MMQRQLESALEKYARGATVDDVLDGAGFPRKDFRVFLADLRLMGHFDLETTKLPKWMLRHYVYEDKGGELRVVSAASYRWLKTVGYCVIHGWVDDERERN